MARHVRDAVRARGSLAVDPKENAETGLPERFCAWDEDRTTLAIDAGRTLTHAPLAFVGPGIDLETVKLALDIAEAHHASDPLAMAKRAHGAALALGCPDDHTAIAALVVDGEGSDPKGPRDVSAPPRLLSAARALAEARRVSVPEAMPDSPMGAYVPWGTWLEDLPARLRLVAQRCAACARTIYPPRAACPQCGSRALDAVQLPPRALVYAATRIGRGGAPSEFALEQAQVGAYWVGVVEWPDERVRVTARLWGHDERGPAIGDVVRPVVRVLFDQEGRRRYGVKFAAE